MIKLTKAICIVLFLSVTAFSQVLKTDTIKVPNSETFEIPNQLNLPKRAKNALGATKLVKKLTDLSVEERELIKYLKLVIKLNF